MSDIEVKLRGNGFYQSDDDFTLALTADAGRYWFTLYGRKTVTPDDDRVQFDFNDMTRAELEELHCAIGLVLDEPNVRLDGQEEAQ